MVTFYNGASAVSFIGQQFYADNGVQADYIFYSSFAGFISAITMQGCAALAGVGLFTAVNGSSWSDLNITGNTPSGVPIFFPLSGNAGTVTRSFINAQGQPINLGASGVLTHTIMLNPGTITAGTQASNGSF
jgi:hypothetical protein